jgi:hypothetical protein
LAYLTKYSAISTILIFVDDFNFAQINNCTFFKWFLAFLTPLLFYICASIVIILYWVASIKKYPDLTSINLVFKVLTGKVMLAIEGFKVLAITLAMLKATSILNLSWSAVLLPLWPLFYIFFGLLVSSVFNFFFKFFGKILSKEKDRKESKLQD